MKKLNTITTSLLMLGLTACGAQQEPSNSSIMQISAPGAPGAEPFWAYAGKTGIGTSFEQYQNGHYSDEAPTG
ncbi:MAG: hypothetical protein ACPG5O_08405, partial [Pseudoalteromonas tetraodonis]